MFRLSCAALASLIGLLASGCAANERDTHAAETSSNSTQGHDSDSSSESSSQQDTSTLSCQPGKTWCELNAVVKCTEDGLGSQVVAICEDDKPCMDGQCKNTCEQMAASKSYLGCKFLAATTSNAVLSSVFDNDFAVIVGNPAGSSTAEVTVSRGGVVVATQSVPAGSTAAIELPMVLEIKGAEQSTIVPKAAYEIESTVPVVAYQFNPLHFSSGSNENIAYSYTNDASLLLPEHTLTGNYMVSTWPTFGHGNWILALTTVTGGWEFFYPGFVTVAATQDGTQVTVTSSTDTADGNPGAMLPGESKTVTLNRGDVLQIYSRMPPGGNKITYCEENSWDSATSGVCPPKTLLQECDAFCSVPSADLTGTLIEATAPVAVFAGHMCTFMPFNQWACDHLEETMFPLETWGDQVVMTAPVSPSGSGTVPTLYRVLAKENGTLLTFTPEVHEPVTVDAGQYVQFQSDQDFLVTGSHPFYVTQTMLGQDALHTESGDPAMGSGVPVFQTRGAYAFLTPDTYTSNYLNVVAKTGTDVFLDNVLISNFEIIDGTDYSVARISLSPGAHMAHSEDSTGFGITSYGYAPYTSYFYPGGMNVDEFVPQ